MDTERITIARAALAWYGAGWHVLELPPGSKAPPPDGRTGAAGVDMTAAEVTSAPWLGNLGVRMPAGVIGLDVDDYDTKPGAATLDALTAKLGPLPLTWRSSNGRPGRSGIRLFAVPESMRWVAGLPGIDIVQRAHRYAVVWPSMHPEGRQYVLVDELADEPADRIPGREDLPELPWPWIGELSRANDGDELTASSAVSTSEGAEFLDLFDVAAAAGYALVIVDDFLARVRSGRSRHDSMQHALIWAMECARAGIVAAFPVINALSEAWRSVMDVPRRLEIVSATRTTEFDAMLRHAIGKARAKPQREIDALADAVIGIPIAPGTPTRPPGVPAPWGLEDDRETTSLLPTFRFGSLPDPFVVPRVEWHAQALLANPTHGELAGPEKSLKSYLGLTLDVGLAAGLPVLGRFDVAAPQRVLLLVGEGGEGPWLRRLAAVCAAYGVTPADIADRVRYSTTIAPVSSPRFVEALRGELDSFGPALVHLDPWYAYSTAADARQLVETGAVLAQLGELCRAGGASLLLNHHYNRQDGAGLRQITGAGHAEWVDSWLLVKHRERPDPSAGRYRLRLDVGSRQWGGDAWNVDLDIDPLTGAVSWDTRAGSESADDEQDDVLIEAKLDLLRIGRRARRALTRAAWLARCKHRAEWKRAALDELIDGGQIVEVASVRAGTRTVSTYEVAPS